MGGGAARSSAGKRAPTTNHNIMASSAKILQLETESKVFVGRKRGKPARFSSPRGVFGCDKHSYVLPGCWYSHLPPRPGRLPETRPRERDMLLCLFPLQNQLWGRQTPAVLLPSFVPGATAGFSSFPPQSWAGRSLQNKSVTATGPARLEKSRTTEMLLFEEGAHFPTSFSPTLKAKAGLPREKGRHSRGREALSSWQCAADVAARQQQARRRGNLNAAARHPQERPIQHLFLQSHSHSANGYWAEGNSVCRQGGSL